MKTFEETYDSYIRTSGAGQSHFGFDLATVEKFEPLLSALYRQWWRVNFTGLDHLPKDGPALIVGNSGGVIPLPALMLLYALMSSKTSPRRLNILMKLDWIEDQRLYTALTDIGFVPWSADNAKALFSAGELVAIFPEGHAGHVKPFAQRYRLLEFDWTQFLPAIEQKVPVFPLGTVGCDEAVPVLFNSEGLARFLGLPSFPVTPFFPWLPFPANLLSLPVSWKMSLTKPVAFSAGEDRDSVEETAKEVSLFVEGEIQAELNRLLRARIKTRK